MALTTVSQHQIALTILLFTFLVAIKANSFCRTFLIAPYRGFAFNPGVTSILTLTPSLVSPSSVWRWWKLAKHENVRCTVSTRPHTSKAYCVKWKLSIKYKNLVVTNILALTPPPITCLQIGIKVASYGSKGSKTPLKLRPSISRGGSGGYVLWIDRPLFYMLLQDKCCKLGSVVSFIELPQRPRRATSQCQ